MRQCRKWWLGAAAALIALPAFAAVQMMSVQVRNGQLRATPSFLGQVVSPVAYGDQVQVLQKQGEWMQATGPSGKTGWIHQSALTPKKIVMASGGQAAQTSASGQELALASKGFNSDVEAQFKKENQVDFTWVDYMEKIKVTPGEAQEFLAAGQVRPQGGAR